MPLLLLSGGLYSSLSGLAGWLAGWLDLPPSLGLLSCAHRYTAPALKKMCLSFIIKHFQLVQASPGFNDLSQVLCEHIESTLACCLGQGAMQVGTM